MMETAARQRLLTDHFTQRSGAAPTLWSRAPGRVDLMGSHTDYNQGYVLTMTIDHDTWLAARPRPDRIVTIRSLDAPGAGEIHLDAIHHNPTHPWIDYVAGVAWVLQEAGRALSGFDGLLHSTVPMSSGLSSSAALEMAVMVMFELAGGFTLDPVQRALLGQRAENHFVGVNCGILDQYTSSMGQAGCALLLDCRTLASRPAPIAPGIQVVICDTQARRQLTGSEYGQRRAQCEAGARGLGVAALCEIAAEAFMRRAHELPPDIARRCRFIVEENARVPALAAALTAGDRKQIAALTAASFAGARDLYEITIPEMEQMMVAMLSAPGVIGARQAGAGFGGCMVALVEAEAAPSFAEHVAARYAAAVGKPPRVFAVQPAPGAGPRQDSGVGRTKTAAGRLQIRGAPNVK
jgi:galactokinase